MQFIAERELRAGVEEHGALGGTVVMMDPHTGEILALVSEPHFNPNDSSKVERNSRINRAVETIYEPGSTFKTITAAAALEEGVIKPTDIVDATMPCRFGSAKAITDVHQVGVVSFEKVFAKSSNCGTARVAVNRLGTEKLMRYVNRFGFGVRATRDFPAESGGIVKKPSDDQGARSRPHRDRLHDRRDAAADGRGDERHRQRRRTAQAAHRRRDDCPGRPHADRAVKSSAERSRSTRPRA